MYQIREFYNLSYVRMAAWGSGSFSGEAECQANAGASHTTLRRDPFGLIIAAEHPNYCTFSFFFHFLVLCIVVFIQKTFIYTFYMFICNTRLQ
jgi:hypothetical protein